MKVRDVLKHLKKDGWHIDRQKGSHRQFKHDEKPGLVTVSGHFSDEIAIGTLKNIYRQAGWDDEQ